MKVRIVSDGTRQGTKVFDEDGIPIKGIQTVTWSLDARGEGVGKAVLTFPISSIEATGNLDGELPPPPPMPPKRIRGCG
ncbi:hypothetical protein CCP3SC15_2010010 [Gammaproteobacteria bacterium]